MKKTMVIALSANRRTYNAALLQGDSGYMLVDTGLPGQYELLKQAIRDAGVSMRDLKAVLLTHQDLDHIGNAKKLKDDYPHVELLCHADERCYIDGGELPVKLAKRRRNAKTGDEIAQIDDFIEEAKTLAAPIDSVVAEGDVLPFSGAVVIHTTGHTPGHISLYVPDDRLLIAGDAMNLLDDNRLAGPNPAHTLDMATAQKSLEQLAAFNIERALCYHGGLFEGDFPKALDAILRQPAE